MEEITLEDTKLLLSKIVEQAVRDYCRLVRATGGKALEDFQSAKAFLFQEDYLIDFGGQTFNCTEILYLLGYSPPWFREQVLKRSRQKQNRKARKCP